MQKKQIHRDLRQAILPHGTAAYRWTVLPLLTVMFDGLSVPPRHMAQKSLRAVAERE